MSLIGHLDNMVRRFTVRLLVGAAGWTVEAAGWLCTKLFGIPTSHVLVVLSGIEKNNLLTLQSASVQGDHVATTASVLDDHLQGLADKEPSDRDPFAGMESFISKAAGYPVDEKSLVVLHCTEQAVNRESFRTALGQVSARLGCQMVVAGSDIQSVSVHTVPEDGIVVIQANAEPANRRFVRSLQESLRKTHGDKVKVSLLVSQAESVAEVK